MANDFKQGLEQLWESMTEGWRQLSKSATSALTYFKPAQNSQLPDRSEVDDGHYLPVHGWSMLGGDVFEDDKRVVVRLELPGMDKQDIQIDIEGDKLVISGEKRFQRESDNGRWRMLQCAYGSFRRVVPLPAPVLAEQANASYRNGVLRVDLPKTQREKPRSIQISPD
ncbi:Hsp20/alpha crystallin family protein [Chitinimonas lacunae]|uniref:Hsp20/alpha crystallin family protein n=1 Tax=Chitinimonas lacunae TaxID=1963018 RepID=A0ABV8MLT6_9NEIS